MQGVWMWLLCLSHHKINLINEDIFFKKISYHGLHSPLAFAAMASAGEDRKDKGSIIDRTVEEAAAAAIAAAIVSSRI